MAHIPGNPVVVVKDNPQTGEGIPAVAETAYLPYPPAIGYPVNFYLISPAQVENLP